MRREIEKASTPLEGIIMPPPRLPPIRQRGLRQKLRFDENQTDSAAETDTDLANIIELLEKVNEKNKSLEATELDIDQQICETRDTDKPELLYKKIADVKIAPEPFRIGIEVGARTNKNF